MHVVLTCFSVAYFPRLAAMKAQIEAKIVAFFYDVCLARLKDKYSEFIIDFGLIGENHDTVVVIELNEFMDTTDGLRKSLFFLLCIGCMFNWKTERKQLEAGPFCFRTVEEPISEDKQASFLSAEWLDIVAMHTD